MHSLYPFEKLVLIIESKDYISKFQSSSPSIEDMDPHLLDFASTASLEIAYFER